MHYPNFDAEKKSNNTTHFWLKQSGFSFMEVIIVIVIFLTITGFAVINLFSVQHTVRLNGFYDTLVGAIKNQQIQAMTGNTYGTGGNGHNYFGVHFDPTSYTLFYGATYSATDSNNFIIQLDPALQFSNSTLTGNNIIFIPLSGEMYGYSPAANSITLTDTQNNQQKLLQFNYLGVLTASQ